MNDADRQRIQDFADRYGIEVHLVGSQASDTDEADSDFDYILGDRGGNNRMRNRAYRELPRGRAGGEIHPRRGETGIDLIRRPLDPTLPHITFKPQARMQSHDP